ncbi:putative small terminase subunit [Gordonia phage GMA3]|uniref:Putative small terminase subunit n=1 Tax=Gordonia phage GMA3 TaxID=1647284 RepID=A0A0K0NKT7_9CAUD|nr:terminase small subunit [Gordonia phage GMA3]AKL88178.1 putative small terminase subunit [Gordonia phage GMA3]
MVKFPGSDYQFFFRFSKIDSVRAYSELGIRRFWLKTQADAIFWNKNRKILNNQWDEIIDCRTLPSGKDNPKYCDTQVPLLRKNGEVEQIGVWSIANHDENALYVACAKFKTVIINYDVHNKTWGRLYFTRYAEKQRWVYDARNLFPEVRFLFFGVMQFDSAYNFGMDGQICAFVPTMIVRAFRPDGSKTVYERQRRTVSLEEILGQWKYLLDDHPNKDINWYLYKMILLTPEFQKEFHSEKNRQIGVFNPWDFSDADYFYGYIFRNSKDRLEKRRPDSMIRRKANGEPYGPGRIAGHLQVKDVFSKKMAFDDGVFCDRCTLNYCCLLYTKGGACRVPNTKGSNFAKKFSSGNAQDILDGMGKLLERKATILDKRLEVAEKDNESLTKEDLSMMNSLFKDATQLAKLRDPALARPQLAIQVNNNNQLGHGESDKQMEITERDYSNAVRELEAAGLDRDHITPDMVEHFIKVGEIVEADQPQLGMSDSSQFDVTEAEIVDYEYAVNAPEEKKPEPEPEITNLDSGGPVIEGDVEESPVLTGIEEVF